MTQATKKLTKQQQALAIVKYASEHGLIINPGSGYSYALEAVRKFNRCPCDENRPDCPCPESLSEVIRLGHCKCNLFWRSHQDWVDAKLSS